MIILDAMHARLDKFMVRDAMRLTGVAVSMYVHPSRTENIVNGRFDTKVKVDEAEFREGSTLRGKIINLEMKI